MRLWRALCATVAIVALSGPPTPVLGEPSQDLAPTTAEAEPTLTVRVLRIGSSLGLGGIQQLAAELRIAGESAAVVVDATGSPDLSEPATDDSLTELAEAAESSRLLVIGDATAVVQAFDQAEVPLEHVGSAAELRARLGADAAHPVAALEGGTLSGRSLGGILARPEEGNGGLKREEGSGGLDPLILVVAALCLGALALAGRRRRRTPARERQQYAAGEPAPSPPAEPRRRPRRRSRTPDDARLPTSGRARVRSELYPEGYVELEGCLRRARWAQEDVEAPATGDWVRVVREHGRLMAFPSGRTGRRARA